MISSNSLSCDRLFTRAARIITLILISVCSYAHPTEEIENQAKKYIETLYIQPPVSINEKINHFSQVFLDKPYLNNPLGEGINGHYSQKPLFRTDGFDCLTYVETVLALTFANNLTQFIENLHTIRYNGTIDFVYRNHFTGLDWNTNAEKQGYITDITTHIKNEKQNPVFLMASAAIEKRSWYQHLPASRIYLPQLSPQLQSARLAQLHKAGKQFQTKMERVPYIPFEILFKDGVPNLYIFNQIPDDSIIEIVRPNWDLSKQIGTHLNISHIGFVMRKDNKIIFRDASSIVQKVSDRDLITYLQQQMLESPTVKGINIHIVNSSHERAFVRTHARIR